MKLSWQKHHSWVAVFDTLGFKELIRRTDQDFPFAKVSGRLEEILGYASQQFSSCVDFQMRVISDTLIFYASDVKPNSYPAFLRACKSLISHSIQIRLPLQGAISCGITVSAVDHSIITGPAFVEAYEYCESQDWVGLLLCPSASQEIRSAGLEPLHHDFVNAPIPWKNDKPPKDFMAEATLPYRFQNGLANFESPLIKWLSEMEAQAPESAKHKYRKTIEFIQQHYRRI